MDELLSRLRAALRRSHPGEAAPLIEADSFTVALMTKTARTSGGQPVRLLPLRTARQARKPALGSVATGSRWLSDRAVASRHGRPGSRLRVRRFRHPAQFVVAGFAAAIAIGTLLLLLPIAWAGDGS